MRDFLKNHISFQNRLKIKYRLRHLKAILFPFNLSKMAKIHKTDKYGNHFYTPHYQKHFKQFKFKKIKLLEIGVGGYDNLFFGGNSLRMWKSYFPFVTIFSLDIYDKSFLQENRIRIFQGSQVDKSFLDEVIEIIGNLDIIIDDGSHINQHVIETFQFLFPKLKIGGVYVVEDTQTSYWPDYGGSSDINYSGNTIMNFFKSLTDGLNHVEYISPTFEPSYFDENIVSIHFYHNLIFIYKGENKEKSNFLIQNQKPTKI
ncbi:class I SAM-dependent methyltransferase [Aequorivita flava]|uniref:Class I SAM-dependent methyltransferase n=1 Tax=Aequorivita flava TaxID=3114371 RepID=A0AB35YQG1_9FLAO